jgi:hypothetical protein
MSTFVLPNQRLGLVLDDVEHFTRMPLGIVKECHIRPRCSVGEVVDVELPDGIRRQLPIGWTDRRDAAL